jgi:DNA-binding Lrp family transcriptional regulator
MTTGIRTRGRRPKTSSALIRREIESQGERLWRLGDFRGLSPTAVASTMARLVKEGKLRRIEPGVYYRSRSTIVGESMPSQQAVTAAKLPEPLQPTGLTAASMLGFTTQNPSRFEYATSAENGPRRMAARIRNRRPDSRRRLSAREGAILEFLRDRGATSDLSPDETARRLLDLLSRDKTFERLMRVAMDEPPRVRAMLGALGQEAGMPARHLQRLRESLGPVSRYDFGRLRSLRHAREWQSR